MGVVECGCKPDCWCKRAGLNLFRWVILPRLHRLWTAEEKEALDDGAQASPSLQARLLTP
jgi:hypothetical protein